MININLIAERRALKLRQASTLRWSGFGLMVLLVLMVVLNGFALQDWHTNRRDLANITTEQQRKLQERAALTADEREIAHKWPIVYLLDQVHLSVGAWMTIMADVSRMEPGSIYLVSLNSTSAKEGITLRFSGLGPDPQTVGKFMYAINNQAEWAATSKLNTISSERIPNSEGTQVRFDFTTQVKGMLGGDLQ